MSDWVQRASFAAALGALRVAAFSIDFEGNALVLASERSTDARADESRSSAQYRARLLVARGAEIERIDLGELGLAFPRVQRLPSGEVLVVASRCGPGENNARVIAGSHVVREFCLGDGIADVQVTPSGRIWCSYFDEGVYGNLGWGEPGGPAPIGAPGLVCFDANGQQLLAYDSSAGVIDDCYALNVIGEDAWAYFYVAWNLVRVGAGSVLAHPLEAAAGSSAFALEGDTVLFAGGYREEKRRLLRVRLGTEPRVEAQPSGLPEKARVVGRGASLHVLDGTDWRSLSA